MRKLNRFELEPSKTYEYVKENLSWANTLSIKLLKLIDFTNGQFFSYMSTEADPSRIYQFPYSLSSQSMNDIELSFYLFEYLKKNEKTSALFEDCTRKPTDPHLETFYKCGIQYNEEIYYLINNKNLTLELLLRCIKESSSIWHSLCLLTDFNFENSKNLNLDSINNACLKAKLIIVGAYDDEGYIFWERH